MVRTDDGQIVLVDAGWCAPAFFEVLAASVRASAVPRVDQEIGDAFETFVRAELQRRGVECLWGEYRVGKQRRECDVIVETKDTVIVIEIKKKILRPSSRSGNATRLMIDLSQSLFSAQRQAAELELELRRAGTLALEAAGRTTTLTLGAREVERVALTLVDYGSLQDRRVLMQILELITTGDVSTNDPSETGAIDELVSTASALHALEDQLDPLRGKRPPFFNCWFLSLGHLLTMLDHVESNEDFWRELKRTRHLSFATLDWYAEYATARRLLTEPG